MVSSPVWGFTETEPSIIDIMTVIFSLFMIIGRLVSGVHWLTDIIGSVLFSTGLFCIYRAGVLLYCKEE